MAADWHFGRAGAADYFEHGSAGREIDGDCGAGIAHVLVQAGQSGDRDCAIGAAIAGLFVKITNFLEP